MILVQDEQNAGIEAATIKIDSIEETSKSNSEGKLTLAKEYKIGATLTIEVSKAGYDVEAISKTISDNNGEVNTFTVRLLPSKVSIFQVQIIKPEGIQTCASVFTYVSNPIAQPHLYTLLRIKGATLLIESSHQNLK